MDHAGNETMNAPIMASAFETPPKRPRLYVSVSGVLVYVLLYQPTWLL